MEEKDEKKEQVTISRNVLLIFMVLVMLVGLQLLFAFAYMLIGGV